MGLSWTLPVSGICYFQSCRFDASDDPVACFGWAAFLDWAITRNVGTKGDTTLAILKHRDCCRWMDLFGSMWFKCAIGEGVSINCKETQPHHQRSSSSITNSSSITKAAPNKSLTAWQHHRSFRSLPDLFLAAMSGSKPRDDVVEALLALVLNQKSPGQKALWVGHVFRKWIYISTK